MQITNIPLLYFLDIVSIIGIAIGLAMDAFSVSISSSIIIKTPSIRHYFRLSFHFGLFQFMMPVIGYLFSTQLKYYVSVYTHWIAFSILLVIGLKMLKDAFSKENDTKDNPDPSRGMSLVILSLATSIDALAVGFSIGLQDQSILYPSIIIGLICSLFSIIGVFIGKKASTLLGKKAEAIGGILLISIGIKILIEHL